MKKLTIEMDGGWVLEHIDDDELPIAILKREFKEKYDLKAEGEFTQLTIIYDEGKVDCSDLKEFAAKLICKRYSVDNIEELLSFHTADAVEEIKKDKDLKSKDEVSDDEIEILLERVNNEIEEIDDGDKNGIALDKINALVGAAEFKALAREIADIAEEIRKTNTYEVFTNRCYLFAIGEGYGLTTYLELLAKLLSESKLCKMAYNSVIETKLKPYREDIEPFESVMKILQRDGDVDKVKVLCVDISEWMGHTTNRYFKEFLRTVEKHSDEFIVVFRVPFVDKDILAHIKYSLSDLLSIEALSFPPLSQDELKTCAQEELKRYDFSIEESAWKYFFERISEEKSDGKFYGLNTVKKVVRELIYHKLVINSKNCDTSKRITENDAKDLCNDSFGSNLSGLQQLEKLVGIESVKKKIQEIIAQIELSMKDTSLNRPCIHMRFVGNPGTGKTTVARILGKILKEKGVLRVGAFFEYAGRDLCGKYIGETAPKTASICRDAYGSVLFIDEAYSLYRGDFDSKDYGREAIDTLIAEMENHRNDFVVIMAGYTSDMEKLMGGNLGLASRMPYTIEFPNFTREQLYDIFVSMVEGKFQYNEDLLKVVCDFFTNLSDDIIKSKDFANARYVRNLFERTWAKAAMRCQLDGINEIVLTADDFMHASADKEFSNRILKKTKMGF